VAGPASRSQSHASRRRATQSCRPARRLQALHARRTRRPEKRKLKRTSTEPTANNSDSRTESSGDLKPPCASAKLGSYTSTWYVSGSVAEILQAEVNYFFEPQLSLSWASFQPGSVEPQLSLS